MIEVQNILCPSDFSEFSQRALEHAVVLAQETGATVHVLHVVPNNSAALAYAHTPPVLPPPPPTTETTTAAREALDRFILPAREMGVAVELDAQWGDPVATIIERANKIRADLVVMGTHGRSGFERLVLGSVTEKVVRKAACPVLTVRENRAPTAATHPRKVLCPTDFSESSKHAARWAVELATEPGSRVQFLHVVELLPGFPPTAVMGAASQAEMLESQAQAQLERLVAEVMGDAPSKTASKDLVTHAVSRGKAHREIVAVAEQQSADLMVMGVHGHGVIDRLFFGSTTHHVVRGAPCPVLSVRHPPHRE